MTLKRVLNDVNYYTAFIIHIYPGSEVTTMFRLVLFLSYSIFKSNIHKYKYLNKDELNIYNCPIPDDTPIVNSQGLLDTKLNSTLINI